MKKWYSFTLILLLVSILTQCNNGTRIKEYYIISKHDSLINAASKYSNYSSDRPPPPPPMPTSIKWYTDLVIVFDSTDKVFLYQTNLIENEIDSNLHFEDEYTLRFSPEYPFFISLMPEHLIEFNEGTFLQFIKDNDDIFRFDTNFNNYSRFFTVASVMDTIKNPVFYSFMEQIESKQKTHERNWFSVRLTTEEENQVVFCKTHHIKYEPEKINWANKYLSGLNKPLTKEYKKEVSKYFFNRIAKETFKPECTKAIRIQ